MIADVGNYTIDFDKVERVGPVGGDPSYLRYTVYFMGGSTLQVYENRRECTQMKREEFIDLWKTSKKL